MEVSFILDRRLALGGGIWTADRMAKLAMMGFTHIVDLQSEFDDTELALAEGLAVLWHPTDDDLAPKGQDFFEPAVAYATRALAQPGAQVYIHCAAGVHRAPLLTAAVLCALGFSPDAAIEFVATHRIGADFPPVYADSLRAYAASARAPNHPDAPPTRLPGVAPIRPGRIRPE